MRYHHLTHVYQKLQSLDVQFLIYGVRQTELFAILGLFLSFYPLNNSENRNFEKMKKFASKNFHFTHVHHKLRSYDVGFLRQGAWRTNIFVILDHFFLSFILPPLPPNNTENKHFEKNRKTPADIIILHMCTINDNHMMYSSWDKEYDVALLGHFLSFFTPNGPKDQTFPFCKKKTKQSTWIYRHFTHVYQKLSSHDVQFLRHGTRRTDGRTEKVRYGGKCPT